jgi:hypothetical protein
MIHIHVDTTCDADLEDGISADTKTSDYGASSADKPHKIEFPSEQDITRDDASDASIELGGVYISSLALPVNGFPGEKV